MRKGHTLFPSKLSAQHDVFPAPTVNPGEICFQLSTTSRFTAQGKHADMKLLAHAFGGFGHRTWIEDDETPRVTSGRPRVREGEATWIPNIDDGKKGRWQRQVRFDANISLSCCPTYQIDMMDIQVHHVAVHVDRFISPRNAAPIIHRDPLPWAWEQFYVGHPHPDYIWRTASRPKSTHITGPFIVSILHYLMAIADPLQGVLLRQVPCLGWLARRKRGEWLKYALRKHPGSGWVKYSGFQLGDLTSASVVKINLFDRIYPNLRDIYEFIIRLGVEI
jgi:hypothetical protein